MNCKNLYKLLDLTPKHISILLIGQHGVGKTDVMNQYTVDRKQNILTVILSQRGEGDFVGIPCKTMLNGKEWSQFAPPIEMSTLETGEGILFLDEINDAIAEVRNASQELIHARSLNGIKIGPGWRVVAACNPSGNLAYATNPMRPQMVGRFLVVNFSISYEESLNYMRKTNHHGAVIAYLSKNGEKCLFPPVELLPDTQYQCPRQWSKLSETLNSSKEFTEDFNLLSEISQGFVGESQGQMFTKFVEHEFKILSADDVLKHGKKVVDNINWQDIPQLSGVVREIGSKKNESFSKSEWVNFMYLMHHKDMPNECKMVWVRAYADTLKQGAKSGEVNVVKAVTEKHHGISAFNNIEDLQLLIDEDVDVKAENKEDK